MYILRKVNIPRNLEIYKRQDVHHDYFTQKVESITGDVHLYVL